MIAFGLGERLSALNKPLYLDCTLQMLPNNSCRTWSSTRGCQAKNKLQSDCLRWYGFSDGVADDLHLSRDCMCGDITVLRALLDGLSNNEFETWESDDGNDLESFLSPLITSQCPRFT